MSNRTTGELDKRSYLVLISHLTLPKVASLVAVVLLIKILYNIYLHPLRKIPGPFLAKATELWRTRKYVKGQWHQDILDLHQRYGPVVRISPNEVSFVDKDALEQVYGIGTNTRKTSWYNVWDAPEAGPGVFQTTIPQEHAFLRKRIAAGYSKSAIMAQETQIQEVLDQLWRQFHRKAENGEVIDLQKWANYLGFDVVSRLSMGKSMGFIESESDVSGVIEAVHQTFWVASMAGYLPTQLRLLRLPPVAALMKWLGNGQVDGLARFMVWAYEQIQIRKSERKSEGQSNSRDLLDNFFNMKEVDGSMAADSSILSEIGNIIGAGADTAAIGMAVVMGQLVLHPSDLRRVQQEIDEAHARLGLSGHEGATLRLNDLEQLPLLNACVNEATRMCPSILWQLPKEAPSAGITIAGYYIPPSATLGISPMAHNRAKDIFGDDADEWRPQRWLPVSIAKEGGSSNERLRNMTKYNTTFGYGPRVCIGRHLAMMEILKFVSQLLRQFEIEPVNQDMPFTRRSQWWCLQENFLVRLRKRDLGDKMVEATS